MTLRRTSVGLKNQPVFFGADMIVYVEGARNDVSLTNVSTGEEGRACSPDCLFWSELLTALRPGRRIHFKPLGTKTALLEFASSLDDRARNSVLVAIDGDFDHLLGAKVELGHTVRTHTYSWESAIWHEAVFEQLLLSALPLGYVPQEIDSVVRSARSSFFGRARRFVVLDAVLFSAGTECLLRRDRPQSSVTVASNGGPRWNDRLIRQRIRASRAQLVKPWRSGLWIVAHAEMDVFGKVVNVFHYFLFVYSLSLVGQKSQIAVGIVTNMAIRQFGRSMASDRRLKPTRDYYERELLAAGVGFSP